MKLQQLFVFLFTILIVYSKLPSYNIDASQISTSGISSGAFMAQQFSVAHSSIIKGVGVDAGGPYLCAQGKLYKAVSNCMSFPEGLILESVNHDINEVIRKGDIDNIKNIKNQQVYLYSGIDDQVVHHDVMLKLNEQYKSYFQVDEEQIKTEFDIKSEHAWITDSYGNTCHHLGSPFINDCGYDMSGVILSHIYGNTNARGTFSQKNLIEFQQKDYSLKEDTLYEYGYLYVPLSCKQGKKCGIHVAFHGCKMTPKDIGEIFVINSGLNEYAETNNLIILYPQTVKSLDNPNGCWDWWGYTNREGESEFTYATKQAPQIKAVYNMIQDLIGNSSGISI